VGSKRDFSLRKPTASQERGGRKKRRLAAFEMTVMGGETELEGARREEKADPSPAKNRGFGMTT